MEHKDLIAGVPLRRQPLIVTPEEAEQLRQHLQLLRALDAAKGFAGQVPNAKGADGGLGAIPAPPSHSSAFKPALPKLTLRLWRTSFENLAAVPALRTAGSMLIDELERAYRYLEQQQ